MNAIRKLKKCLVTTDEFELKFSGSSRAKLKGFWAEPSLGISIFELKPSLIIIFNQIFQFCAFTIIITSNSDQMQDHLYKSIQKAFFVLNTMI